MWSCSGLTQGMCEPTPPYMLSHDYNDDVLKGNNGLGFGPSVEVEQILSYFGTRTSRS